MPDDGAEEAAWVQKFVTEAKASTVKAIVGSVDLASPDAEKQIIALPS